MKIFILETTAFDGNNYVEGTFSKKEHAEEWAKQIEIDNGVIIECDLNNPKIEPIYYEFSISVHKLSYKNGEE